MLEANAAVVVLAPGGAILSREYIHKRDSALNLRAPLAPGRYELAGYADGASAGGPNAVARVPFTVMESSAGAFSVSLDKEEYSPAELIKAFVSGVPGEALAGNALAGMYASGGPPGKYISYEYVRRNGETLSFRATNQPGEYEIRAFTNGEALSELTTAARVPFRVSESASGAFSVSTPKENYSPREMMTVNVNGVPKHMLDGGALLSVSVSGAEPGKFISYKYITVPDGSYEFEAPQAAGEYEIIGYTNNNILSDATLAARARFMVSE